MAIGIIIASVVFLIVLGYCMSRWDKERDRITAEREQKKEECRAANAEKYKAHNAEDDNLPVPKGFIRIHKNGKGMLLNMKNVTSIRRSENYPDYAEIKYGAGNTMNTIYLVPDEKYEEVVELVKKASE